MHPRLTLMIETSTPHASLGLADGAGEVVTAGFRSDRNHNALLFGPLAELLAGRDPAEIGLVLVGSGPGSYSGTRVGIAAAQGVALVAGCRTVAVPSILALPSSGNDSGFECLVIGDARRGAYWTAWTGGTGLTGCPALTEYSGLLESIGQAVARKCPVLSLEPVDRFNLPADLATRVRVEIPTADGLWRAWRRAGDAAREAWSAVPPQPIYLKPPHITEPKRSWLTPGRGHGSPPSGDSRRSAGNPG